MLAEMITEWSEKLLKMLAKFFKFKQMLYFNNNYSVQWTAPERPGPPTVSVISPYFICVLLNFAGLVIKLEICSLA